MIEIRGLTKRFGSVLAVDDLTFDVDAGQVVGFLGPNGAGKTTTLRMLLGLVTPTAGTALVAGRRYVDLPDPTGTVGAALEAASFYPGRTARDHLRIQALAGRARRDRIDEVLDLVDLTRAADRRVGGFSLGMRQRLGLATALLHDPQVLILDEPANGLDPEGVRWLRELLRGLADEGRTVLISSHILAEVAQTADNVVILDHGRLVAESPLSELVAGARPVVRIRTSRAEDLSALLTTAGIPATVVAPDRVEVSDATPERIGTLAAEHRIPIFETSTETANLEDVFFQLTGGAQ
ncbi:MAG TPA: ABC transporter ATP-binding protein [Jatrophihabitantaceae bacterium]